jgi:hypothetical protein
MIEIKINEPQPVDCPQCKAKYGYQYSDYISVHFTSFHEASGEYEGAQYSDYHKTLNKGKSAYCLNCRHKLPKILALFYIYRNKPPGR